MDRECWQASFIERLQDLRDEAILYDRADVATILDQALEECKIPSDLELRFLLLIYSKYGNALSDEKISIFPPKRIARLVTKNTNIL